ncbi:fumarylacetoacetate hydrolase family protein [Isoalcanivorax indicus]|uniref:fumarylacetoacetate hydrolase family protein n=1 Tax=Isoalcanivorax indicus TaxID=2202653 RepID=UPI000DBAA145|nr:fumarylacetoacetate hydrolase family protein [Isoalcanivorax indicus]
MKIKRLRDAAAPEGSRLVVIDGPPGAQPPDWLLPLAPAVAGLQPDVTRTGETALLPFQPRSFRDGMLFERHWIQSSRGYVRRFMPSVYPLTRLYETVMRRPFPAFRPPALWQRQPIYYFGNHLSIVAGDTAVAYPDHTRAFDYELELGIVLGKPLHNASPEQALDAIGGFVVLNDFSGRDIQRAEMQSGFGPQKCKHFMSSISQQLVTADEVLPRIDALAGTVHLNGDLVTRTSTAGMRYSLGELLSFLSCNEPLFPGELIGTGTLPGGCGMEAGRLLERGDTLRLAIEGVGEITHTIL